MFPFSKLSTLFHTSTHLYGLFFKAGISLIFIIAEIPHNSKGDNVFYLSLSVLWGMGVIEKQSTALRWPCPFKPFIVHLVST